MGLNGAVDSQSGGLIIENRVLRTVAYICFTYAYMLREEPALIATAVMGIVGRCEFVRSCKTANWRKLLRKYICCFAPAVVIVICLHAINAYEYSENSLWAAHPEYNTA